MAWSFWGEAGERADFAATDLCKAGGRPRGALPGGVKGPGFRVLSLRFDALPPLEAAASSLCP